MALKELARLFVRIRAPREDLKSDLQGAKQDVEQFGNAAKGATDKASAGIGGVGDSIKSSTSGARNFVGAITGSLAIFTRLLGVVGLITAAVVGLKRAWDAANSPVDWHTKQLAEMVERTRSLRRATEDYIRALQGGKRNSGAAQIDELNKALGEAQKKADEFRKANEEAITNPRQAAPSSPYGMIRAEYKTLKDEVERVSANIKNIQDAQRQEAIKFANEIGIAMSGFSVGGGKPSEVQQWINSRVEAEKEVAKRLAEQQLDAIRQQEAERLRLQIENWNQLQALQQSAAQFNNAFAYDIRRLASTVEQIKGRLN